MKKLFQKPTVFLILGVILILIGIPSGIYLYTLSGGASLGGVLILMAVFIVFVFLVIDRALVRKLNSKKVNIIEVAFLIIASTIYFYLNRKIEIEQLNQNSEFIIVIENNKKMINNNYEYKFPFNKKIRTNENFVIAKNLPQNINLKRPKSWGGSYYYNVYKYPKYPKVVLFGKTAKTMDSLKVLEYIETNIK